MSLSLPGFTAAGLRAAAREIAWSHALYRRELARWSALAAQIPDPRLRSAGLEVFSRKRSHVKGSAFFSTLPTSRSRDLVRALVAYEVIYDYLDVVSEMTVSSGRENGEHLFRALVDAVTPGEAVAPDYYALSPHREDRGFLAALVGACRASCARLPAFALVAPIVSRDADRGPLYATNHEVDPAVRTRLLQEWAEGRGGHPGLGWFELAAADSTPLTVQLLLALAADAHVSDTEIDACRRVYYPWVCLLATMLDSHIDRTEDAAAGSHSYVGYYANEAAAARRLADLTRGAVEGTLTLRHGERHALLVALMIAVHLSKESASAPADRRATSTLIAAGGWRVRATLPLMRRWRTAIGQADA